MFSHKKKIRPEVGMLYWKKSLPTQQIPFSLSLSIYIWQNLRFYYKFFLKKFFIEDFAL